MRILDIQERPVPISRYADPTIAPGGLTTSIVAVATDAVRDGKPVVGYGFSSIGRFAQSGLIRERFAPRLVAASESQLANDDATNLDPFRAWTVMMKGEKPGGHGERCVAVGALDMAIWDAAAKIAQVPLARFLGEAAGSAAGNSADGAMPVYAGGGYYYPDGDVVRLREEMRHHLALGYTHVKIKIGGVSLAEDLRRIEAVLDLLPSPAHLAVDAMNAYGAADAMNAAVALRRYGLWWFEDICDPLDFEVLAAVAAEYDAPIAAGEALFSLAEARLLERHGGMRPDRDVLLFDPAHCYGLPEYLRIIAYFEAAGWPRSAFRPHGGHLFGLHVASALGLGVAEVNPTCFLPFGGLADGSALSGGRAAPPQVPGIGFEAKSDLHALFASLPAQT